MAEHHTTLRTRELELVVGDNQAGQGDLSHHRAGYNGLWSLSSVHAPGNVFVPSVAGMNLEHFMDDLFMSEEGGDIFEPRHLPMGLERLSSMAVRLVHDPSPLTGVTSQTRFEAVEPHFVDFEFYAVLHQPPRAGSRFGFFWASYIHAPESPCLFFKDARGLWNCLSPDQHGDGGCNTVCHSSIAQPGFGDPGRAYRSGSLAHAFSQRRFELPLMYGRPGDGRMLFLLMFDQRAPVRLCMSPSGGGTTPEQHSFNPAWDFQYVVDQAHSGQEFHLRARLVYKLYRGRDEMEELYAAWSASLQGAAQLQR